MENGFAIFGIRLSVITVAYGTFLLLWGVMVSLFADSYSITSWIPSFIGIPILLGGTMSLVKPEQTKLWMHVAMVFGVITFIGGLDFLRGLGNDGGPFSNIAAGTSKLMLLVTGLAYSGACLASFIQVRRNRQTK